MKSEWADAKKQAAEIKPWITKLTTAAAASGDETAKKAAAAALAKFNEYAKKADEGTRKRLKELYDAGVAAVTKAESAGSGIYELRLVSHSNPKFWHNATNANKVPVWTYGFQDTKADKDKGQFTITMTAAVGKNNENKQSEMMNSLAIAEVKKLRKDAKEVKLTSK